MKSDAPILIIEKKGVGIMGNNIRFGAARASVKFEIARCYLPEVLSQVEAEGFSHKLLINAHGEAVIVNCHSDHEGQFISILFHVMMDKK